jgi:hypothetical protein
MANRKTAKKKRLQEEKRKKEAMNNIQYKSKN